MLANSRHLLPTIADTSLRTYVSLILHPLFVLIHEVAAAAIARTFNPYHDVGVVPQEIATWKCAPLPLSLFPLFFSSLWYHYSFVDQSLHLVSLVESMPISVAAYELERPILTIYLYISLLAPILLFPSLSLSCISLHSIPKVLRKLLNLECATSNLVRIPLSISVSVSSHNVAHIFWYLLFMFSADRISNTNFSYFSPLHSSLISFLKIQ